MSYKLIVSGESVSLTINGELDKSKKKISAAYLVFFLTLNDLFVKVSIKQSWRIDAIGFDKLKGLRRE